MWLLTTVETFCKQPPMISEYLISMNERSTIKKKNTTREKLLYFKEFYDDWVQITSSIDWLLMFVLPHSQTTPTRRPYIIKNDVVRTFSVCAKQIIEIKLMKIYLCFLFFIFYK